MAGNRTNAGISNPHDQPVSVSVTWRDGDGEFHGAVMGVPIPARGVLTINDIFDWTGQRFCRVHRGAARDPSLAQDKPISPF